LFVLCPPSKNLVSNLESHIYGLKHVKALEDAPGTLKSSSFALSTERRDRPTTYVVTRGQSSLYAWFTAAQSTGDTACALDRPGQTISRLSFLCWGFWLPTTLYNSKKYSVKELREDPHKGSTWYCEVETRIEFNFVDKTMTVNGCFCHVLCKHLSISGDPFPSFTCSECANIHVRDDFRKCVIWESRTVNKRGSRSTANGTQVSYLSTGELALHSRLLKIRY
jgi:hypothetical protein